MNRVRPLFSLLFAALMVAGCHHTAAQRGVQASVVAAEPSATPTLPPHPDSLRYPAFEYSPPNPLDQRVELPRGAVAYLVESDELPLINLKVLFKEKGWSADSADIAAYSTIDGMMRRGGTAALSPAAVDDSLERHAVSLSLSINDHFSSLSIDALDSKFEPFLPLLKNIALEPRLDTTELELTRSRSLQSIAHRYDRPTTVSRDLYQAVLYGPTHPALWSAESSEVATLSQEQLRQFSQNRFRPETMLIGVAGKFDRTAMIELLSRWVEEWPAIDTPARQLELPTPRHNPGLHLLDYDSEQTQIRMGQPFVQRPHPDYYASSIASYILGSGGLTSRLTAAVRSREGLTYSIHSFVQSNYFYQPTAGISVQTKVESTGRAMALIFQEIEKLAAEGPTADELNRAIDGLINSLPSLFDTPENSAEAFLMNELWGRPATHYADYPAELKKVTAEDVKRVVNLYFNPANMAVTVVGPAERIRQTVRESVTSLPLPETTWSLDHLRQRREP